MKNALFGVRMATAMNPPVRCQLSDLSLLKSYDAVVSGDFNVYGALKGGISFPSPKYEDLLLCLWPWKMNFSGVHNHILLSVYVPVLWQCAQCGRLPVLWQWVGLSACGRGLFDFRTVFYFVLIRCKSSFYWVIYHFLSKWWKKWFSA